MNNFLRTGMRCAYAAGITLISTFAHALDLTVQAGYTAEYTDNIALTADNEESGWIHTPQILLNAAHEGPSVTASANYNISREIYQNDAFDDQTTATGTALLTWRAIAERLSFDAANTSTQTTIDSRIQDVPTNQQVTNTATAGTTLNLDGPSNHLVNLRYEYAWVTAQRTDTDSQRQTGTASYIVPLSEQRRVQLNGTVSDVNYSSSRSVDYVSRSADVQYVSVGDQIELDTSIGYTVFDQAQQADDVSGTTGNLNITWHTSDITSINASYSRSIEDQSTDIATGIPDFGETLNGNSGVTTPYTLDATSLGISTQLGHNTVDLTGYLNDQNYDDGGAVGPNAGAQQDQNTKGVTLGIGRALRPTLSARMYANYSTVDYENDDNQDTYSAGLRFNWTRWRNLSVSAGTDYEKRTGNIAAQEYTEWSGSISLFYTLIGRRK